MARCLAVLAILPLTVPCAIYLSHVFYFAGTRCESKATLTGKTVIVTGANTGIGKATASDMAARGARVILACRSAARALPVVKEIQESTKNLAVVFMQLDLASLQSVRDFARSFLEKEERLDILINNAGIIHSSNEPELSEDGIEMTIAVNHLGPFLLTNLLVDILKKSGPGARVVTVSSVLYNLANPAAFQDLDLLKTDGTSNFQENLNLGHMDNHLSQMSGIPSSVLHYLPNNIKLKFLGMLSPKVIRYNNSKLANILFAKELAKRLAATGVSTYALHPGVIATEIGIERGSAGQNEPVPATVQGFKYVFGKLVKNQVEGAQTTICCAVSERFANESGNYYSDCNLMEVRRLEANPELTAKFWDWSATLVGLKEP